MRSLTLSANGGKIAKPTTTRGKFPSNKFKSEITIWTSKIPTAIQKAVHKDPRELAEEIVGKEKKITEILEEIRRQI